MSDYIIQGSYIKEHEKHIGNSEGGEIKQSLLALEIKSILKNKNKNSLQVGDTIFVPVILKRRVVNDSQVFFSIIKPKIDTSNNHGIYFLDKRTKKNGQEFKFPTFQSRQTKFPVLIWIDSYIPCACIDTKNTPKDAVTEYQDLFKQK